MNKEMQGLNRQSFISIGLALAVFGGLMSFSVYQESRITKLETQVEGHTTDPNIHQEKIEKLEAKVDLNREILIELRSLKEAFDDLKRKIDR